MINRPIIIVANWNVPPFFFITNKRPNGYGYEILTTILKRKHMPFTVKYENWTAGKKDIAEGKADITCTMYFNNNPKDCKYGLLVKFMNIDIVRRKSDKFVNSMKDLSGLTIFVQKSSRPHEILSTSKDIHCKLVVGTQLEKGIIGLSKGIYDGVICSEDIANNLIRKHGLNNVMCNDIDIAPQEYKLMGNNEKLINTLSNELYKMKQDGTYTKITDKWFPAPIVKEVPRLLIIILIILVSFAFVLYWFVYYLRQRIKRSEARQVQLFSKYKVIFDNAFIGIQLYDSSGLLEEVNDAFCNIYEVKDKNNLLSQKNNIFTNPLYSDYIHKDDIKPYSGIIRYDFDEIAKNPFFKFGLPKGIHYFDTNITPVFDNEGIFNNIVVVVRDMTQMVNTQDALKEESEKAQTADRLKTDFLANMSHEIRTPLNAIVGFSNIIDTVHDEEERKMFVNMINTNSELLLRLVNDILDLSKIESGSIELEDFDFDINELIVSTYKSLSTSKIKPDGVEFRYRLATTQCPIKADYDRLSQILTNFVTNAFKHTTQGYIEIGYHIENGGLELYVEDTGEGIPTEKIDKIFDRFEKLDRYKQGTGLGLSICKAITDRYHGKIWVESTVGKGSTFHAWIPMKVGIA